SRGPEYGECQCRRTVSTMTAGSILDKLRIVKLNDRSGSCRRFLPSTGPIRILINSLNRRFAVAAKAVLALGVARRQRVLPGLDMAGQAVLLELDAAMREVIRGRGIALPWRGKPCDENHHGHHEPEKDEVGRFERETHQAGLSGPYASFSNSAM